MEGSVFLVIFSVGSFLYLIIPSLLFYSLIFGLTFYLFRKHKALKWTNALFAVGFIGICLPFFLNLVLIPEYYSLLFHQNKLDKPIDKGETILLKIDFNNELSSDHAFCNRICQHILTSKLFNTVVIENPHGHTAASFSIKRSKECDFLIENSQSVFSGGECLITEANPETNPSITFEYIKKKGDRRYHNSIVNIEKLQVTDSSGTTLFLKMKFKASMFKTPLLIHPHNHKFHMDKTYLLDPRLWFVRQQKTLGEFESLISYADEIFTEYQ